MKGLILFAALFAALLFVPSTAEAGCLQGRPVLRTVKRVIEVRPGRAALRVAILPGRLVVRALR